MLYRTQTDYVSEYFWIFRHSCLNYTPTLTSQAPVPFACCTSPCSPRCHGVDVQAMSNHPVRYDCGQYFGCIWLRIHFSYHTTLFETADEISNELKAFWVLKLCPADPFLHYSDAMMSAMASQIIGVSIFYSIVYSGIKENIKAPRHWPFSGEFTGDRWIPRTKGQYRGKCFHFMTSPCNIAF